MKVVSIGDREQSKRKANLLEVLDALRAEIEAGDVEEFLAVSIDSSGEVELHACVKDIVGGVGMLEIGKNIFIHQLASD